MSRTLARIQDPTLLNLVDSLVASIDLGRNDELDRLREALEPFGAVQLFNDELRINGVRSSDLHDECHCEVWL